MTMVSPPNSATAAASQRTSCPAMSYSTITQTKPATSAAAAGLGSPWKKRLSVTVSSWVLKPRQSQGRAGAIDEGGDPTELAHALQGELVDHQRGGDAERHHVGQAVVLGAKGTLRVRHAGDPAIETVEHHGDENGHRRMLETPVHCLHHGIKPGKQRARGEQIRQQVDAAVTHPRSRHIGLAVIEVEHGEPRAC